MNSRSQGNIARNISKIKLQPQHLEVISTYEISKGNIHEPFSQATEEPDEVFSNFDEGLEDNYE